MFDKSQLTPAMKEIDIPENYIQEKMCLYFATTLANKRSRTTGIEVVSVVSSAAGFSSCEHVMRRAKWLHTGVPTKISGYTVLPSPNEPNGTQALLNYVYQKRTLAN